MKYKIPIALIYLRSFFGLVIPILAYSDLEHKIPIIITLIILGFLSDIFDGIVARKLKISTKRLRLIDSVADRFFWLLILYACYILHPEYIVDVLMALLIVLALDMTVYVVSLSRFRKIPSPHNLLSKLWGILVAVSLVEIIASGSSHLLGTMIVVGIVSRIDSLIIYSVLKNWDHDIPTFYHAYLLSKGKSIKRNKLFNG